MQSIFDNITHLSNGNFKSLDSTVISRTCIFVNDAKHTHTYTHKQYIKMQVLITMILFASIYPFHIRIHQYLSQ